jgi:hypothetical protein
MYVQGRTGSPNFDGIFFQGASKKKNSCKNEIAEKKKPLNKNSKGLLPPPK